LTRKEKKPLIRSGQIGASEGEAGEGRSLTRIMLEAIVADAIEELRRQKTGKRDQSMRKVSEGQKSLGGEEKKKRTSERRQTGKEMDKLTKKGAERIRGCLPPEKKGRKKGWGKKSCDRLMKKERKGVVENEKGRGKGIWGPVKREERRKERARRSRRLNTG